MQIANISFPEYPVFLAPMEDVTDPYFRLMCRQFGADMVYTEFVSADALIRGAGRTGQKLELGRDLRPVAVQIYGKDVDSMVEAAKIAEAAGPDILDINFGCPVKKIAGKGAGAGLLRDIPRMLDITRAVVKAVSLPVTVKTRLGWDASEIIIGELAPRLQDCGIAALTIHGRTRAQMYTGDADWSPIAAVKADPRIRIPIIGNGDITTPEKAKECFERYGVDAVMVGRAAIGQPWIFRRIKDLLEGNPSPEAFTPARQMEILKRQVADSIEFLGERRGILHVRRHIAVTPLFKGIPNFKPTKIRMLRAETVAELFSIFDEVAAFLNPLQVHSRPEADCFTCGYA